MRLLLLDSYDSFTWNLAHYLEELGAEVDVRLNDAVSIEQIEQLECDGIVISPGPGRPEDAGIIEDVVRAFGGRIPLLGVCLGHQAIARVFGGRIVRAPAPVHGKTTSIDHDGVGLFEGLPPSFEATRYHSLVVEPDTVDPALVVGARTAGTVIMALRHREWPLYGVQFHPESILTRQGKPLLRNFLRLAQCWNERATHAA